MYKQNELLKLTMNTFRGSFINHNNELILVPRTNLYFLLDNIESELEFKCKILEWCSRDASKTMPYNQLFRNREYWTMVRAGINCILGTDFNHEDMYLIYSELGNCVNRNLTIQFIESNYDMSILKEEK